LAATNSTSFPLVVSQDRRSSRDWAELFLGFGIIMLVLWVPAHTQTLLSPVALAVTLTIVISRERRRDELGIGVRGLPSSLWILPAAVALTIVSILVAKSIGTYHPLYHADFGHVIGYVLWTVYQQFLLQDLFMPRLTRLLNSDAGIVIAATLFAAAHLPNISLAVATLVWGAVSCLLFRRYHNIYALGLAQGLLGLCFAVCVPDAWHHHLRVGLGYLHYPH
jgi:membrane protease YdiL (CAAX protease family)